MKRVARINERDLTELVRNIISEQIAVPFGYEENNPQKKVSDYYVNITNENSAKLPVNLKQFLAKYKLLNTGQIQMNANGDKFKYIPNDKSQTLEFTLNEFNTFYSLRLTYEKLQAEYMMFEKQYEKIEELYDKFDNLITEE